MNFFSYKLEHDYGLAPNPFHGYCTLAVCKSDIRKNSSLSIGDWIIGTGSKALGNIHHLIYAMRLEEKLSFNDYWNDIRFQNKKPIIDGSLVQMYGDNFYHQDLENKQWIQENSAHSMADGNVHQKHLERDVSGEFVLISQIFYYFGDRAPKIPDEFLAICNEGRNMKSISIPNVVGEKFIQWLQSNHHIGIHGDPICWSKHLIK